MNIKQLTFLFTVFLFTQNMLCGQSYYSFKENGKYGFKDSTGKILIRAVFEDSLKYKNGVAIFYTDRIFIINRDGNILRTCIHPKSDLGAGYEYSSGLLACQDSVTNKFGYLDTNGNWKIPPKYYQVADFKYDLATVWEDPDIKPDKGSDCGTPVTHMKWGVIKRNGRYLIKPKYLMPAKIDASSIIFEDRDNKIYRFDHKGKKLKK